MKRLKAIVIAYECSPGRSHVAGSAWQIITRLSKNHDLLVITEENGYKDDILKYQMGHSLSDGLRFAFIPDSFARHGELSRPVIPMDRILAYRRWQREVCKYIKDLLAEESFDLLHHLRTNTFREPGMPWETGLPFVWGPVGGNTIVPWQLLASMPMHDAFMHFVRNILNYCQLRFSRRVKRSGNYASVIIAQTEDDFQRMRSRFPRTEVMLAHEQACEAGQAEVHSREAGNPLKLLWVGRFAASKALNLALEALAQSEVKNIELHIVGSGKYETTEKKRALDLGVNHLCRWHGWKHHAFVQQMMQECDALLFTSLLEATSTTVVQALSAGLPVICLDHCGFGELVDADCGLTVSVSSWKNIVSEFAERIKLLANEPERISILSAGAARKAEANTWDHTVEIIDKAYRQACDV